MQFNQNIKLGVLAKDRLTNVEGILTAAAVELNGNWRLDIQPLSTDNKLIDAIATDYDNVIVTGAGIANPAIMNDSKFELGQKVRDKYNGIEGIVHRIIWHTNGCVFIKIKCFALDKLSGGPKTITVQEIEVEAIEPPPQKTESKPTGGPVERVMRRD